MARTFLRYWLVVLLLSPGTPVLAHEFWMLPDRFEVEAGSPATISLFVGENFSGERVGLSTALVARFQQHTASRVIDLASAVPAQAAGELSIPLRQRGTHLIVLDSQPSAIELPADKFNAYLELEGLQQVMQQRASQGQTASPGRERYRRTIKTIISSGGASDRAYAKRTGQRLEVVPLTDPRKASAASPVTLQMWFDGRPLPGALVKLWNKDGPALLNLAERSDARGRIKVPLPRAGVWMVSVVHMIPVTGSTDFDWDSYWGNLTFEVPTVQASSSSPRK